MAQGQLFPKSGYFVVSQNYHFKALSCGPGVFFSLRLFYKAQGRAALVILLSILTTGSKNYRALISDEHQQSVGGEFPFVFSLVQVPLNIYFKFHFLTKLIQRIFYSSYLCRQEKFVILWIKKFVPALNICPFSSPLNVLLTSAFNISTKNFKQC